MKSNVKIRKEPKPFNAIWHKVKMAFRILVFAAAIILIIKIGNK